MKQQINLYQDELIERNAPLHAGLILTISLALGLVFLASSLFLSWQQGQLNTKLASLNVEQGKALADLQILKEQNPPRQKDPLIALSLKEKQSELAGRKPLLAYLDNFNPEASQGFSGIIKGFAQYPLKGVWLTGIRLDNREQRVLLAGSAIKSDLIPTYVQHLGDKSVLKNQNFASLKIAQVEEQRRQVDFRLESDFGAADE